MDSRNFFCFKLINFHMNTWQCFYFKLTSNMAIWYDDKIYGRPKCFISNKTAKSVKELARNYRRFPVKLVAEYACASTYNVRSISTKSLNVRRLCGNVVPTVLIHNPKLKRNRIFLSIHPCPFSIHEWHPYISISSNLYSWYNFLSKSDPSI